MPLGFFADRFRQFVIGAVGVLFALLACALFVPWPRSAEIRLPQSGEQVPLDLFDWNGAANARSIATITTCFTRETWLTTDLYSVRNGTPSLVAHWVTGRSSLLSRPHDPRLMTFPVTFALADARTDEGHTTLIAMRGATRSTGNIAGLCEPFEIRASRTFEVRIQPDESRLLYVEGDRDFAATAETTLQEFAARNAEGSFLVVVLRLER